MLDQSLPAGMEIGGFEGCFMLMTIEYSWSSDIAATSVGPLPPRLGLHIAKACGRFGILKIREEILMMR